MAIQRQYSQPIRISLAYVEVIDIPSAHFSKGDGANLFKVFRNLQSYKRKNRT
jgi:hypothetical protein